MAGGFGVGTLSSRSPQEIAPVVSYRNGLDSSDVTDMQPSEDDIETGIKKEVSRTSSIDYAPLLPADTPFFHLDLQAAVKAAESGLSIE